MLQGGKGGTGGPRGEGKGKMGMNVSEQRKNPFAIKRRQGTLKNVDNHEMSERGIKSDKLEVGWKKLILKKKKKKAFFLKVARA